MLTWSILPEFVLFVSCLFACIYMHVFLLRCFFQCTIVNNIEFHLFCIVCEICFTILWEIPIGIGDWHSSLQVFLKNIIHKVLFRIQEVYSYLKKHRQNSCGYLSFSDKDDDPYSLSSQGTGMVLWRKERWWLRSFFPPFPCKLCCGQEMSFYSIVSVEAVGDEGLFLRKND